MNQFVSRVANYIANELIVKGLANSRTFQRIALRAEEWHLTNSKRWNKTLDELTEQAAAAAAEATGSGAAAAAKATTMNGLPPTPPLRGIPGFFSAFFKEIGKDLGAVK